MRFVSSEPLTSKTTDIGKPDALRDFVDTRTAKDLGIVSSVCRLRSKTEIRYTPKLVLHLGEFETYVFEHVMLIWPANSITKHYFGIRWGAYGDVLWVQDKAVRNINVDHHINSIVIHIHQAHCHAMRGKCIGRAHR